MPPPPHGSSGDMTTREMVMNLMAECLVDARKVLLDTLGSGVVTPEAVVDTAAAMFEARWTAGTAKLLEEVKRQ